MIYLCEKFCPEELKAVEVTKPPNNMPDFDYGKEEEEEEEEKEEEEAGEVEFK
jgi:hypothetical protein